MEYWCHFQLSFTRTSHHLRGIRSVKISMGFEEYVIVQEGLPRPFPKTPSNVLQQFRVRQTLQGSAIPTSQ
ncbi:hypothetical protein GGS24DRAFT_460557 [Hypoxylon argillaceum]|nr:hypothetical protein GGS24DRAFT_460557 [Hypoxylon argillaceum]